MTCENLTHVDDEFQLHLARGDAIIVTRMRVSVLVCAELNPNGLCLLPQFLFRCN